MAEERGPAHKELAIKGKDERAGRRAKGRSGQWKQGPMRSKSNLGYGFSIWNQISWWYWGKVAGAVEVMMTV